MLLADAGQTASFQPYIFTPVLTGQWPLNNADLDSNTGLLGAGLPHNGAGFDRHPGKRINAAFADGSIRSVQLADWKVNKDGLWGY